MMARETSSTRQSLIQWGARIMLASGAAWLGSGAVTRSAAYAIRVNATEQAWAMAPGDGRIAGMLSEVRLKADLGRRGSTAARRLARAALLSEPMAVSAAATLGLDSDIAGNRDQARRLLAYAQKLSRRDLRTQLWMIEDAVARNDITGALRHYDIALRTSRVAPELLFPVLADAIGDTDIRAPLIRTLANRPAWGSTFIDYAAANASNPDATATLLRELEHARVPVSDTARALMINKLLGASRPAAAWAYYATIRPMVDPRRSRDPLFTANLANPSPFDWLALEDDGVMITIRRGEGSNQGFVDFAVAAGRGGAMLRQMQVLPPGTYTLTGQSANISAPDDARPYWSLTCINGRELGRLELPVSASANGIFAGRFTVPVDCPVQYLTMIARPTDQMEETGGRIDRVELRPAD